MIKITDNNSNSFGDRLRDARQKAGMTQKELAEIIGVSPSSISKFENGDCLPNGDMLIRFSTVLGESINMLISGFEDPKCNQKIELIK